MVMRGKCKNCGHIYDVMESHQCPNCGCYPGSALDGVDILSEDQSDLDTIATSSYSPGSALDGVDILSEDRSNLGAAASCGYHIDPGFLQEEYFHCQKTIDSLDQKAITIKAWSVTSSMVGIGAAYTAKIPELFILSSGTALLFWLIEALWKTFQSMYISRADEIESYCRGRGMANFSCPGISRTFRYYWHKSAYRRLLDIIFWPHVYLPYAPVVLAGIVLYFLKLAFTHSK